MWTTAATAEILLLLLALVLAAAPRASVAQQDEDGVVGRVFNYLGKIRVVSWSNTGWSIWSDHWVDFDFGCSTCCLVLLGLMGNC